MRNRADVRRTMHAGARHKNSFLSQEICAIAWSRQIYSPNVFGCHENPFARKQLLKPGVLITTPAVSCKGLDQAEPVSLWLEAFQLLPQRLQLAVLARMCDQKHQGRWFNGYGNG